ncbi:MAG: cardiolipin synthase B [Burkholderiales bacterium]|nr:cardiolipin synthase B [Burkholderiales bacterium]
MAALPSHRARAKPRKRLLLELLAPLALLGCAATPPRVLEHVVSTGEAPRAVAPATTDGKRMLAPKEAAAVIKRLERHTTSELLARHLALVESHVQEPLIVGNRSTLLVDGPQTHAAMFEAMALARYSIELQTYILEAGEIGERLAVLLERKRREGVSVRILYDAVGSMRTPVEFFDRLKASGIAACAFNPVKATGANASLTINNRDHRKILVVDRRLAFTGGINISSVYSSGSFGGSRPPADPGETGWRDTHIQLEGPVVDGMQALFESAWRSQQCPVVPTAKAPAPSRAGSETMRVIAQDPAAERNEVYIEVLSALAHSEHKAWLTFGYFVPDPQTVAAIKQAAMRGVDIRLLVPSQSDVWLTLYAGRSHYADLLAAGVRIFERRDAVLHAKTAVIDGVWSTVGTSNLDWRSFVHNFEVNIVILGADMANQLEALFRRDLAASEEITAQAWASRGLGSRLKETFARMWAYYL